MKNNKGITLVTLVLYIVLMCVVMIILGVIVSEFYNNTNTIQEDTKEVLEFNKFNTYFLKEIKSIDNNVDNINDNYILFTSGNSFSLSDNKIYYNDIDITDLSVTERAKLGIGYAFQQPPRFKGLTVRRLLSLAAGSELPVDECCGYLTSVGLCSKDYLNREIDASLSGGELKRIEIATLMARNLGLAIYDEPEAGIDLWSFNNLINVFENMHKKVNGSILIISHQERILDIADKIVVVSNGEVTSYGKKEDILPTLLRGDYSKFGCVKL